ncbi:MAG: type I glyceraldehyde-3-phosphate dehydrogenase [Candidatus Abawacabacteria bacterium RBG_16_42_10]|uniref:Glyceraldehyde-3-phosphate dehydrogenase n=1 Tax=Candidatus Abawacabacteria bacterium RBG_16_42_10 TaxID=1817814 RepID=A0A1F4XJ19_9BACT|nr:MAG: type I glyceraldehyde-3-phosphate dehydrogenase [Candidatus Abawacabacteria bacterium RBG_16_42_10]
MKKIRIGINGFGRIGRLFMRIAMQRTDLEVVAINSGSNPESHAFLFQHDSSYGAFPGTVEATHDAVMVNGKRIAVYKVMDPAQIPWDKENVDIVVECSGLFTDKASASKHLHGGVKKVIISAPGKDMDATIVLGVNEQIYDPNKHTVIANASCTTNCLTPIAYLLNQAYGIKHAYMCTVHSYTNDQNLQDNSHPKDLRRARSAATNIVPTTTGAAIATIEVIPELKGKINGIAIRVPNSVVSILDLVAEVNKEVTKEEVNEMFRAAANGSMKKYLSVNDEPLVSSDYKASSYSAIIDSLSTEVIDKTLVSIIAWYDNEWGYSERLADITSYIGSKF